MRAIGRLFAVSVGYIAAVVAAAVFLLAARVGLEPRDPQAAGFFWSQFAIYGGIAASFIGAGAFAPWVVLALLTEMFSLRSFLLHVGAGGLIGLGAAARATGLLASTPAGPSAAATPEATLMIAAGFVGGFVYWLLAGRMAGLAPRDGRSTPSV